MWIKYDFDGGIHVASMDKVMGSDIAIYKFELQSRYYVHF